MTGGDGPCPWPNKVAYPTKAAAKSGVHSLRERRGATDLDVYPCVAGHFHVGHSIVKLRRRIRTALRTRRTP